jgi:tetratricopeptide (TPR) repeat protein
MPVRKSGILYAQLADKEGQRIHASLALVARGVFTFERLSERGEVRVMADQGPQHARQDVVNEINASVAGAVVQAGTVSGGVHVHESCRGFTSVVPRQLPAPPALFTGRDADLARLTRALSEGPAGTMAVSAVGGAGGIGKTWLVLHWAYRHIERFPDGQLHVDLRGFSPDSTPVPASAALRGFLCALGVEPAVIPVDEHAQAALFRSLAAGKRMLIVLDNAASTEQVTPLLPGSPTCAVLVTSRRRLSGLISAHGARYLALDVLADQDARALLAARIGNARLAGEPEAAGRLVAACGGFPLALSVVAGRAAAHPQLPLNALATELRDAGLDGLDDGDAAASVPAVLSWSYRVLTPQQARVFALLGIAPGPDISLTAAASLAGMHVRQVQTVLRTLEQASLLIQHMRDRYRMHDLTRASARDHANRDLAPADQESALVRVVSFYVHTAHRARHLLEPHDIDIDIAVRSPDLACRPPQMISHAEALNWFTTEHQCLLHAQLAARNIALWAVWQLAWALTAYHSLRGLLRENLYVWHHAELAAEAGCDTEVDILVRRHLGNAYLRAGNLEMGREYLCRALTAAERAEDVAGQARIHRIVSVMYEHQGDNQLAFAHASRALELFQALDDPVWEADTLNTVGWCAALLGRYGEARRHCHTAFPVLRLYHPPGAADALDTLGYIAHHTGGHTEALDYLRRALALYRDLGDIYHVPDTLDRIGHVLIATHRTHEALAVWKEALALYRGQQRITDARRVQREIDTPEPRAIARSWPYRRR